MGQISLQIPQVGLSDSTEDVKVANNFTTLQNTINGNIDATNITNAIAQSATVNTGTQTVKGATNIATSESRTNVAFGTLTTPDQVTGIVLPTNGLIAVWYWATWQQSVNSAASADIFVGANQLKSAIPGGTVPAVNPATLAISVTATNFALSSYWGGLMSANTESTFGGSGPYGGDVTTGQVVGFPISTTNDFVRGGGPCYIFAAAGTYTVSVQFKATSGSVTASNRKLWCQAFSFA